MLVVKDIEKLRRPCEMITSIKQGLDVCQLLVEELEKCSNGVGLSAPQIGIHEQASIIKVSDGYKFLINPVITKLEKPALFIDEGCLSFPSMRLNTIRYWNVSIKDDLNGEITLENFGGIVAQHEIDHLNGTLFFDHKVPEKYEKCFCGTEKKFKFCCWNVIYG